MSNSRVLGIILLLLLFAFQASYTRTFAQSGEGNIVVTGVVSDDNGETLPGVSVMVKGTRYGVVTNIDGAFTIRLDNQQAALVFSLIGFTPKEETVGLRRTIHVTLSEDVQRLDEVVVVGYGQQKKQSLVGAIQQVGNEELRQTMGTSNLAQALTGKLPGVTTMLATGEPGNDDPLIFIRGQSTWNNSQPLILVDGVERKMNDVDVNEVESISVLKDASATAVFGVKGAEGVILITTKRGKSGKAQLSLSVNSGIKLISKVPKKLDAYEGLRYRNIAIENELPVTEGNWLQYIPTEMLLRYKHPQQPGDMYVFPNVDWAEEMVKDFGHTLQANLNISGGTDFAKYFSSLSFNSDGDILKSGMDNGLGYQSKWGYDRFNYRINLDFNLTPTTVLSTNLAGYVGTKYESFLPETANYMLFTAFYNLAPSAFPIKHENGMWGYNDTNINERNPVKMLNTQGLEKIIRSQINTDFKLMQKLDFITPGLSTQLSVSFDNTFRSSGGVFDNGSGQSKYIDPNIIYMLPGENENKYIKLNPTSGTLGYDYVLEYPTYLPEGVRPADFWGGNNDLRAIQRRLFYQIQMNYARQFGEHDLGLMAVMNREEYAIGDMFPSYREDWVGRVTYNYDERYLLEANGAYNGSEKFGVGYRFGFFPSVAVGWLASNEKFLKYNWLDKLKFRYSIGKVGNDNFSAPRWAYETVWGIDSDRPQFGNPLTQSPYTPYFEKTIGNPDLHWEVSLKQNLGIEIAVFKNMLSLNVDIFKDDREDIFLSSAQRNIPSLFGQSPVAANLGRTTTSGYEIDFTFRNSIGKELNYWARWSFTHAKDKILFMEDPLLLPAYQKREGFQIDQTKTLLDHGFLNNWDDIYSSVYLTTNNGDKLPGDFRMVDFNGDGQIDDYDRVPYAYPTRPQNTYNFSFGGDFKGFSANVQFYGVYNTTRRVDLMPFQDRLHQLVFDMHTDYWSPANYDAAMKAPRIVSQSPVASSYLFDASYLRLKTVELSYTFTKKQLGNIFNSARVFVNGNNLFLWTKMPDDREDNSSRVQYPTMKRYTVGVDIQF